MLLLTVMPLFLLGMGLVLLGLLLWGFRQPESSSWNALPETRSYLEVWLLILAVLSLSAFLTYILFGPVLGG